MLTSAPAELYGLRDRGVVREGAIADLVVLDEDRIAVQNIETRFDLPAGAGRLYAEADGIDHVLVAGSEIARDNVFTGEVAGRVLRSGRDTANPDMS
jgi:N-acyl-D-aspartate/D-glutamate deacylase